MTKRTLLAAAALAAGTLAANAAYYEYSEDNLYNGSNNLSSYPDSVLVITGTGTYDAFYGVGDVVIRTDGGVQLFEHGAINSLYYTPISAGSYKSSPYSTSGYLWWVDMDPVAYTRVPLSLLPNWTGGELRIEAGTVYLTEAVNAWADYGTRLNSLYWGSSGAKMWGVDKITLYAGTILDVSEWYQTSMIQNSSNVLISLHNLNVGSDLTSGNGDVTSGYFPTLVVGNSTNHCIDIHIDAYDGTSATLEYGGSVGFIEGSANIYKTGDGDLAVYRDSLDFYGNFYAAGGSTVLHGDAGIVYTTDDPTGVLAEYGYDLEYSHSLSNAASVNISGTVDSQSLTGGTSSKSEAARGGADVRFQVYNIGTTTVGGTIYTLMEWKNSFFPDAAAGTLVIEENQVIKNFQAMFAVGASATDSTKSSASAVQNAADEEYTDSPLIPGTGSGSYLVIAEDATLAVRQESGHGGIYKGTICGGVNSDGSLATGGTFLKYGEGDLALILESASYSNLVCLEGKLVTNVVALNLSPGVYDWAEGNEHWVEEPGVKVYGGELVIIENDAATLKVRLEVGEDADLVFSSYELIDTLGGEVDASNNYRTPGTIEVVTEQRFVTGNVIVKGGTTLVLTADDVYGGTSLVVTTALTSEDVYDGDLNTDQIKFSGGTFGLAKAIILTGVASEIDEEGNITDASQTSKLSFNNTNQKVNNLVGDIFSEVDLGRGTMTVNIDQPGAVEFNTYSSDDFDETLQYGEFRGSIQGVGNVIKTGAETLTLSAGPSVSYFGAMIVEEGNLVATTASTLCNVSALALNTGTVVTMSGDQQVAALYGAEGSEMTVDGALIVGNTASRQSVLERSLAASGGAIVTAALSNSNGTQDLYYADAESYLKPITDLLDGGSSALIHYADSNCSSDDWDALDEIFAERGLEFKRSGSGQYSQITEADYAWLYLKLLADNSFVEGKYDTMLERLSFDGSLTVDSLEKVDSNSRLTISGTLATNYIKVTAGVLEVDYDTLGIVKYERVVDEEGNAVLDEDGNETFKVIADVVASDGDRGDVSEEDGNAEGVEGVESASVDVIAVSGNVADGILIEEGAVFSLNTTGAEGETIWLDEEITGHGNFEKTGDGKLILGSSVAYTGTTTIVDGDLEMTLRAAQGDVTISAAGSTLTLIQDEDLVWSNSLTAAGDLVKKGAGTLTLDGTLDIAGNITVEEGRLIMVDYIIATEDATTAKLKTVATTGTAQTITIKEGATFTYEESSGTVTSSLALEGLGTFEKSGVGTLVLNGDSNGDFAGTLLVSEGELILDAENFAENAVADVEFGARLEIDEDQTFRSISGDGSIYVDSNKTLTLTLKDADGESGSGSLLYIDSSSGTYTTVEEGEIYEFSGDVEGGSGARIVLDVGDGAGVFSFASKTLSNIDLEVVSGTMIVDASVYSSDNTYSRTVYLSGDGEIVFNVPDEEDAVEFGGTINTLAATEVNIGKYGAGTFTLTGSSVGDANLYVYQGELIIKGSDASVFSFAKAVVASDAVIAFDYAGFDVDLSNIEGSGTILLSYEPPLDGISGTIHINDSSTMLTPIASADGKYFNGILSVEGVKLEISVSGTLDICSIASAENADVLVDGSGTLTIYQEHNTVIEGSFNSSISEIEVTGSGRLVLASTSAVGKFLVKDGSLQVDAKATLSGSSDAEVIRVDGNANLYFSSDNLSSTEAANGVSSISAATIGLSEDSSANLKSLGIYKAGETAMRIDLSDTTDGGQSALSINDELWNYLAAGKGTLTLGVEEGEFELRGVSKLDDFVELATLADSTLSIYVENSRVDTLSRNVSGSGNFVKDGAGDLSVTSSQSYTGTTTISAGTISFSSGTTLATSNFIVESGATLSGGVTLTNGSFQVDDGGSVKLNIGADDAISYAGTLTINGTIYLTGSNAKEHGYEMVIFKNTNPDAEELSNSELVDIGSHLKNEESSLFMISQTSPGTISAYSIPDSFADINGVKLRDGLVGSFTSALDAIAGLDKADQGVVLESELSELGVALNKASASNLGAMVANLSPLSYSYMTAVTARAFQNDIDRIEQRTEHRRFDTVSDMVENGMELFASAQGNLVTNSKAADAANYDYKTFGVFAGVDQKLDDFSLLGLAVAYDYGKADIHSGGGKIESNSGRATVFGSTLFGDDYSFFVDGGVSVGWTGYDVKRKTIVGSAKGDTDGLNIGAFANVGRGFLLYTDTTDGTRLMLTARTGVSVLYTDIDSFNESGMAGLDTRSFDAWSVRWTIGLDLDYVFPVGEWYMRVGIGAGYSHEFADDDVAIRSKFRNVSGSNFRVDATMFSRDSFYLGPTITLDLSDTTALFLSYHVEYATNDFLDQNINLGFRYCF
ncbi:MAG: autotransporter domain-containing protein [Opitutae bacterium]|nr:autotransporter domain-containing protein [Opitutae bacterium]